MAVVQSSGKRQSDAVNLASTVTYNAASNFTAGNTVIITLVHYGATAGTRVTGITVSGTSAVKDVEKSDAANLNHVEIWRASSVAGGNTQVIVTGGAQSGQYLTCGFEEWDNISASPFDQSGTGGETVSANPSATTAGATAQADEVAYAAFVDRVGSSWTSSTPPSGYTESWEEPDGTAHEAGSGAYKVLSAIATETATFTTGASITWHAVIATYKLGGGATATTLSGPSSASTNTQSGAFTVGADGAISGTVNVTPSDGGKGGTFTPSSVAISSGTPTNTFTYANTFAGTYAISTTNDGGLSNPSSVNITLTTQQSTVSIRDELKRRSAQNTPAVTLFIEAWMPRGSANTWFYKDWWGAAASSGAFTLAADPGTYSVTGASSQTISARILDASPSSYSITGAASSTVAGRLLDAGTGSYSITGGAAALTGAFSLNAGSGTYAVTGVDPTLQYTTVGAYTLSADPGTYTITGANASAVAAYLLDASSGTIAVTGADANLIYAPAGAFTLSADPGSYSITGADADLAYVPGPSVNWQPGGSGHPAKIRKPKRIDQSIESWVDEIYSDLTADPATAQEAGEVVKAFAKGKASIPKSSRVDWEALSRNAERVNRLIRLWEASRAAELDDEEAFLMGLL